ncbi:unnamed protein product [Caenorhabditis brenneri]
MCPEVFDQKCLRRNHEMSDHVAPYNCQYCSKVFEKRQNFIKHMQTHNKHKQFTCNICKKNLSRRDNLIRHYTTVHEQEYERKPRKLDDPNIAMQNIINQFMAQLNARMIPVTVPKVEMNHQEKDLFDFKNIAESHEFPSVSEYSQASPSNSFTTSSSPSSSHSPVPQMNTSPLFMYFGNRHKV